MLQNKEIREVKMTIEKAGRFFKAVYGPLYILDRHSFKGPPPNGSRICQRDIIYSVCLHATYVEM